MNETDLLHLFIQRTPIAIPTVRVFRRNIINRVVEEHGRKFQLRNGIKGQADAYALVTGGLHIEIETKSATGMREAQKRWRSFCEERRIPHLVLRAHRGESSTDTVTRWIDELRAVVESKAT
jgi:hypothetical protein